MNRIEGTGNVNNITNTELNPVKQENTPIKTFGDGFATTNTVGIERNIAGLNELISSGKFNFEIPQYPKGGYSQLTLTNEDYQRYAHLDNYIDIPETQLCEA